MKKKIGCLILTVLMLTGGAGGAVAADAAAAQKGAGEERSAEGWSVKESGVAGRVCDRRIEGERDERAAVRQPFRRVFRRIWIYIRFRGKIPLSPVADKNL